MIRVGLIFFIRFFKKCNDFDLRTKSDEIFLTNRNVNGVDTPLTTERNYAFENYI